MAIVLWLFLLFASLYHVLVTVLVYGLGLLTPETIVIVRDGIWLAFVLIVAAVHRRHILPYLKRTRKLRTVFVILCVISLIVSFVQHRTMGDMLVGAKYGLQFFVLFLMSIFLGHVFALYPKQKMDTLLRYIFGLFIGIMIVGFLWQVAKIYMPDFFYHIGYAALGDWVFGHNPPIYYLTGPGGYARLSGIFSGPNNYGYLFVGLFGFVRWYLQTKIKNTLISTLVRILFGASVLRTMSRGAILGVFLQIIALSLIVFKIKRKYLRATIIVGVVVVGGLSILKRSSTLAHVRAKLGSLSYVAAQPLGYGLGSSGPSIHTGHGTILPENFFVQILIDIGVPGMILWLLFRYIIAKDVRRLSRNKDDEYKVYRTLLICVSLGFIGLLFEGMFLHVFEDSMVNYWFFVLRGLVYGYVSVVITKSSSIEFAVASSAMDNKKNLS